MIPAGLARHERTGPSQTANSPVRGEIERLPFEGHAAEGEPPDEEDQEPEGLEPDEPQPTADGSTKAASSNPASATAMVLPADICSLHVW